MSPGELPWLHDVFMSVGEDFDQYKKLIQPSVSVERSNISF